MQNEPRTATEAEIFRMGRKSEITETGKRWEKNPDSSVVQPVV
jgi:hypothetical protein